MEYISINVCEKCEVQLSDSQKMYAKGTCCHCGNTSNSTVTDSKKIVFKRTRINPSWKIWKKQYKYTKL
jgi:hypothetical protein